MYGEEICLCGINGIFRKPHESQVDGKRNKGITKNMFSPTFFLGRISYKCGNKNENGIFCHKFLYLGGNLPKKILLNFFHHIPLRLGVGVGGSFLLDFYFLGQVLETCCHFMLNHFWDVHIWYSIRNLKIKLVSTCLLIVVDIISLLKIYYSCERMLNTMWYWKYFEMDILKPIQLLPIILHGRCLLQFWSNLVSINNQLWVLVSNLCIQYHVLNRIWHFNP